MGKIFNTKQFEINDEYSVYCRSENTSYGFRHVAELQRNNWETTLTAKCTYYNRTWEAYEFESVLEELYKKAEKDKTFDPELLKIFKASFDKWGNRAHEDVKKQFGFITAIAKIGEILTDDKKEQNDWKKRILKAGLENQGLDIPEDFDRLPENEREKRLNGGIDILTEGGD